MSTILLFAAQLSSAQIQTIDGELMVCWGKPQTCKSVASLVETKPGERPPDLKPIRFDWKPVILLTSGPVLDRLSTWVAIEYGHGCEESNPRYIEPPYSPSRPNFGLMWRDAGVVVGTMAAAQTATWLASRPQSVQRSKWSRVMMRVARWTSYGANYVVGGTFAAIGVTNTVVCF